MNPEEAIALPSAEAWLLRQADPVYQQRMFAAYRLLEQNMQRQGRQRATRQRQRDVAPAILDDPESPESLVARRALWESVWDWLIIRCEELASERDAREGLNPQ